MEENKNLKSTKEWTATAVLCFLLGFLGAHNFYVGKISHGILQLFTCGGFGIWVLIDFINITLNKFKDSNGLIIERPANVQPKFVFGTAGILFLIMVIIGNLLPEKEVDFVKFNNFEGVAVSDSIAISGNAKSKREIKINDKLVNWENNNFSISLPLEMGENKFIAKYKLYDKDQTYDINVKRVTQKELEKEKALEEKRRKKEEEERATREKQEELEKNCKRHPEKALEIKSTSWGKEGFGAMAMHNVKVYNPCPIEMKDIKFKVTYFAKSNTKIDSTSRTIYDII
ncbi:MAG: TM2 domain-containing protein, partial [Chitinophagales bacterium]|nr:TM2 domain-containing protein [Chitinophagales bacterium]